MEDAFWTLNTMLEALKPIQTASLSKRGEESPTIATGQGSQVNGKMTKTMAEEKLSLQME